MQYKRFSTTEPEISENFLLFHKKYLDLDFSYTGFKLASVLMTRQWPVNNTYQVTIVLHLMIAAEKCTKDKSKQLYK